ncbi:MAG TPA: cyanophycin synthetase, partial [Alphaproteobacteria bacterium]
LYEEHLDWHKTKAQYFADKLNLLNQSKIKLIGNQALEVSSYQGAEVIPQASLLPQNRYLTRQHNAENVAAVLAVLNELGVGATEALPAMQDYKGLPHRQYELGEKNGILYVDDSIATTPQSTNAALDVYKDRIVTLIAGGYDRGIDYGPLLDTIKAHKIAAVVCLGQSGKRIAALLKDGGISQVHMACNMAEAVGLSKAHTQTGGVVLLSPAAPSFGLFTDYQERGKAFAKEAGF